MPKKERIGIIIRNSNSKTITVMVKTKLPHKKYGKFLMRTKKYIVHDKDNEGQIGDIVLIQETKPLSKTKRWQLINKLGTINN